MSIAIRVLIAACILPALITSIPARAEVRTGTAGGNGGEPFSASCPVGYALAGAYIRSGAFVDGAWATCVEVKRVGIIPRQLKDVGGGGGSGGTLNSLLCDSTEVVTALFATSGMVTDHIRAITKIRFDCIRPAAVPSGNITGATLALGGPNKKNSTDLDMFCPVGQVATGIYGRAGKWLDQIGLICNKLP